MNHSKEITRAIKKLKKLESEREQLRTQYILLKELTTILQKEKAPRVSESVNKVNRII